jgi:2-dehydro-3-deoxyphosphooctonate aldolase (KDO 8-P synthase)
MTREVPVAGTIRIGGRQPLTLIGGPCAIENEKHALMTAERLVEIAASRRVPFIYKSSYDKANRSSVNSYRGPGLVEGLRILRKVREAFGVPVLSDIHQVSEVDPAAEVLDVLQIPAFLCRQTDLLIAAAKTGRAVNVKKGQFLAPDDMAHVVAKLTAAGGERILLTERGTSFGYHDLVVDMRALVTMRDTGWPVVYDATHTLQKPGGPETGGDRRFAFPLMRAAIACGVDGLFFETHPDPAHAKSDAGTQLPLERAAAFLDEARRVRDAVVERAHA